MELERVSRIVESMQSQAQDTHARQGEFDGTNRLVSAWRRPGLRVSSSSRWSACPLGRRSSRPSWSSRRPRSTCCVNSSLVSPTAPTGCIPSTQRSRPCGSGSRSRRNGLCSMHAVCVVYRGVMDCSSTSSRQMLRMEAVRRVRRGHREMRGVVTAVSGSSRGHGGIKAVRSGVAPWPWQYARVELCHVSSCSGVRAHLKCRG